MAKKELALEINLDSKEAIQSAKNLKQQFTEVEDKLFELAGAGKRNTAEFKKAQLEAAALKQEIDNINTSLDTLKPEAIGSAFANVTGGLASGFAGAQGAMALFGAEGEDLQKTLVKVQSAMAIAEGINGLKGLKKGFQLLGDVIKENPIVLFSTIIIGIGTALFALKDKIKPVADAFNFLGDVIDTVVNATKDFLDYIGLTNFALDEQRDKIIANNEAAKKSVESRYDAEIRAAKRAGEETEAKEIMKNHAIIELNNSTIRTLKAKGKERTEDEEKMLDELLAANRKYVQENLDLADAAEDRRREQQAAKIKEFNDKKVAEEKAHLAHMEEVRRTWNESLEAAREAEYFEKVEQQRQQELADQTITNDTLFEGEKEQQQDYSEYFKELHALTEQEQAQMSIGMAEMTNNSLMALSDAVFAIKMQNLQKGSAAELKAAKQQFKINKALAITQATISTIQGVINALSAQVAFPEPYATIYRVASAAAVGIAGAANIAKISAQQFNAGGGGGGGGSVGAAGGGVNVAPPSTGSTLLNADGSIKKQQGMSQPTVKAIVTETDITQTQKRVNSIEETSKIK